jgi:superfamily II DNA or RNA helicase
MNDFDDYMLSRNIKFLVTVSVCNKFGVKYLGISNYEMLKNGNYYIGNIYKNISSSELIKSSDFIKFGTENYEKISSSELIKSSDFIKFGTENYEKVKCPYMDIESIEVTTKIKADDEKEEQKIDGQDLSQPLKLKKEPESVKYIKKRKHEYKFYLPKDTLVIFDEAHRCKNWSSQTSSLLIAISKCDCKIMMLSATLTDKIDCFKPFGIVLDFYKVLEGYRPWIKSKEIINKIKYKDWEEEKKRLDIVHNAVFPQYGSRMKIKELGNLFPSNTITANSYFLDDHLKVEELYKEINKEIEDIHNLEKKSKALGVIIRNRMRIEMLKVTLFMELTNEALESGYSVVIFVNYIGTLEYLCYHMKCDCIIKGGQELEDRDNMIKDFQANKKKLIIVMQQAGGVGISLHDIHGAHPRMSIISPSWSGQEMRQTLGRIHRAGSKTPAIQKIVYVAQTYEEQLCNIIKTKLRNIDALNDGDLSEYKLEEIQFEENKNKDIDHAENKQILVNNQNLVVEKPKKKYVKKTTKK